MLWEDLVLAGEISLLLKGNYSCMLSVVFMYGLHVIGT